MWTKSDLNNSTFIFKSDYDFKILRRQNAFNYDAIFEMYISPTVIVREHFIKFNWSIMNSVGYDNRLD